MVANHIVHSYDQELNLLTEAIVNMGLLVKDLLNLANDSLQDPTKSLVEQAKSTDKIINNYNLEIEQQAINLLALRQPMAIDLRQAISALKLAVIMERMGDLAKSVTTRAVKITITIPEAIKNDIDQMTSLINAMLADVIEAFRSQDDDIAFSIPRRDKEVDNIYTNLMDKLESDMVENTHHVKSDIQLIYAIKNFERIGDYVAKIARITHYIITGERIFK
jgi:phosphate transport system protein